MLHANIVEILFYSLLHIHTYTRTSHTDIFVHI